MFLEASNQDFLFFVIKYLSDDKENWQNEWVYDGQYRQRAKCVCGKEGIETVFVVRNEITNKILSPIGSVCIDHFSKNIMKKIKEDLNSYLLEVILRNSARENNLLAMSKKFFSKQDLEKIENAGVINNIEKNICLKALNKRSATLDDFRQANDILIDKIIPALKKSINASVADSSASYDDVYFDSNTRRLFERLYKFSKSNHYDISDFEDLMTSLFDPISNSYNSLVDDYDFEESYKQNNEENNLNESLKIKRRIYNEIKILDSIHKNFYEARIACKHDKKYLILENHLYHNKYHQNDYSYIPSEVNIFEIKQSINRIDEIVLDEDFENNFNDYPEPSYSCKPSSKKELKEFLNSLE